MTCESLNSKAKLSSLLLFIGYSIGHDSFLLSQTTPLWFFFSSLEARYQIMSPVQDSSACVWDFLASFLDTSIQWMSVNIKIYCCHKAICSCPLFSSSLFCYECLALMVWLRVPKTVELLSPASTVALNVSKTDSQSCPLMPLKKKNKVGSVSKNDPSLNSCNTLLCVVVSCTVLTPMADEGHRMLNSPHTYSTSGISFSWRWLHIKQI